MEITADSRESIRTVQLVVIGGVELLRRIYYQTRESRLENQIFLNKLQKSQSLRYNLLQLGFTEQHQSPGLEELYLTRHKEDIAKIIR